MDTQADTNSYGEDVEVIRQGFEYELCSDCGGDLGDHVIAPDPLGHAHAWCQREGGSGEQAHGPRAADFQRRADTSFAYDREPVGDWFDCFDDTDGM